MSPEARSRVMRSIRGSGTGIEMAIHSRLTVPFVYQDHRLAHADFSFPQAMVVLFVDGEFWHGRNNASIRQLPGHWITKIMGNKARDRRNRQGLAREGWCVISVWESCVNAHPDEVAAYVSQVVRMRAGVPGSQLMMFDGGDCDDQDQVHG